MKLEGEIGEINVIERLVELGRGGFTGAVRFENDGIIKIIYFKNGDVLSASTNDRTDSVDEILLRANKVTREHVKQALAKRKENETLGDALLGLGFITRKELSWARRVQVIGAIRSVADWNSGSFNIVADYLPKREEGTIFPLTQLLVELVVTDNDRQKFDRALDGGNVILDRGPDFDEQFARLSLNEEAEQIVGAIDGERNAAEVALASGKDAFNVYKLLHALETVGILVPREPQASPQFSLDVPAGDYGALTAGTNAVPDSWMAGESQAQTSGFSWDTPEETPVMSHSAFDDAPVEEPETAAAVSPLEKEFEPEPVMASPSWDAPAPINTAVPPPPLTPREPQWGFDEAQIETARRAAVPLSSAGADEPPPMAEVVEKASKPNRWIGALIAAVVIVAIGFAGLAGWNWWQKQNEQPAPVVVQRPKRTRRPVAPAAVVATGTTATSTTSTSSTGTSGTSTTGTIATLAPVTSSASGATTATSPASHLATSLATATSPVSVALTKPTNPHPPATSQVTPTNPHPPAASQATSHQPPATSPVTPAHAALPKVVAKRTPAGAVTITSTGAPATPAPAAADSMRSHYDEMAHTFASQATGSYTIQFELVCQTASLTRAVQEGGSSVWFVPTTFKGQSCYRVFWGHYATKAEAVKAKAEVPKSLGANGVVVAVPK